jgi:hypothetical protein
MWMYRESPYAFVRAKLTIFAIEVFVRTKFLLDARTCFEVLS